MVISMGSNINNHESDVYQIAVSFKSNVWAQNSRNQTDIEWFKENMKIDPKYQEQDQSILGMSYVHFFIMAFLILFFIGTFINSYLRNKRTRYILQKLLKEEGSHDS